MRLLDIEPAVTEDPAGPDMYDLRAENRRLRSGVEQMRDEVLRLGRALEPMHRLNEEVSRLRVELDRHQTELRAYREQAEHLEAELKAAAEIATASAEQLAAVYASSSWRLTRPLRYLMRRLRH